MIKQIKVGVIGVGRGRSMIRFCEFNEGVKLVAICDKWKEGLERCKKEFPDDSVKYVTDADEFFKLDMDVVILANYAHQHAVFAVRAMKAGYDVISEVLPAQTLKEAVELAETVETTGRKYMYAENYCYMPGPREMKRLYRSGALGDLQYGEAEYIHNCEVIWPEITYGERDHWRNNMNAFFYCTHSIGPIVHATGLRPVKVTGFELAPRSDMARRMGRQGALAAVEMLTMSNGCVVKSVHGELKGPSVFYALQGVKGYVESTRDLENMEKEDIHGISYRLRTMIYPEDDSYLIPERKNYIFKDGLYDKAEEYGHGGSDFYTMWNCFEYLRGNPDADIIDVYEALDMSLPGIFGYKSALAGGVPMEIPDFRNKAEREKFRNDTTCCDRSIAGDMYVPSCTLGNRDIPDEVYKRQRDLWFERLQDESLIRNK